MLNKRINYNSNLLQRPSPLQFLTNVSQDFQTNIYVKRDDLLGVGFGGNKARKLNFILKDAKDKNAKVVLTSGSLQSNHCLLTTILSNQLGLKPILILLKETQENEDFHGNRLLEEFLDVEIHILDVWEIEKDKDLTRDEKNREIGKRLEKKEEEVLNSLYGQGLGQDDIYSIYSAGSSLLGILSYVDCVREISQQTEIHFDYIFCGNGSGGTYGGMALGGEIFYPEAQVVGINIEEMDFKKPEFIQGLIKEAKEALEIPLYKETPLRFLSNSLGKGYGLPDPETFECISYLARREGFFTDPIYTGKIFRGALKEIRERKLYGKNILILHSGGLAGIYNKKMMEYIRDKKREK